MSAPGVRRDKGGVFQWVQGPPGNCSSRPAPASIKLKDAFPPGEHHGVSTHRIFCAFYLTKLRLIALADTFLASRHTLVASCQHLTRVLLPNIKSSFFLIKRKLMIFYQLVGCLIISLRMLNPFNLRY